MGWVSFNLILACFSPLSVPSLSVELLPGAQRGAVQAAAQAGPAAALLAAAGAAEGQVAPGAPGPAHPGPLAPPRSSGSLGIVRTGPHGPRPSQRTQTNHRRTNKKPQTQARQVLEWPCCPAERHRALLAAPGRTRCTPAGPRRASLLPSPGGTRNCAGPTDTARTNCSLSGHGQRMGTSLAGLGGWSCAGLFPLLFANPFTFPAGRAAGHCQQPGIDSRASVCRAALCL